MRPVFNMRRKLEGVFPKKQADVLADVITHAYGELVKTGDFNELKGIVKELAEAQKRTEMRIEELAIAQSRTEKELRDLVKEHRKTREQVGGLATTVGYTLENASYKRLPELLKRDFGIVTDRLKRQYVKDNKGSYLEVNIVGKANRDGKDMMIIGESKSQLSKKGINEFIQKKLKRFEGVYKEIFPIVVTHMISAPDVEEYAKKKGIALYYSYDF